MATILGKSQASGPSNINFSVLKAGANSGNIVTLGTMLTKIPMLSGYSPLRWRKATNAVLLRKEGVFLAHKLRTIILFEANFNYTNKYLERKMIQVAHTFGHLASKQYGSQKGYKAILATN